MPVDIIQIDSGESNIFRSLIRLNKFLLDPQNNQDLIENGEFIPGVKKIGMDKLYPESELIYQKLIEFLNSTGYQSIKRKTDRPRNTSIPTVAELRMEATRDLIRQGIQCNSCKSFIEGESEAADMQKCPNCNEILLENFRSKGLAYVAVERIEQEQDNENSNNLFPSIRRSLLRNRKDSKYSLSCKIETNEDKLDDIKIEFSGSETMESGFSPTFALIIDKYDRESGLVYCYIDQSQLTEEDIKALQWNSDIAEKSFKVLADKIHGKRLIISVNEFKNFYSKTNYTAVKEANGIIYGERETLPIAQTIEIYNPWLWDPKLVNSYATWCNLVNMTEDIGFYSSDHPFQFSEGQISKIEKFIKNFTNIDVATFKRAIGCKRAAPDVIRALAKLSNEAVIHNPNFFGAIAEGMDVRLSGKTPNKEQILQEMIYFKELFGTNSTLSSFLKSVGVDISEKRYSSGQQPSEEESFYQDIWNKLNIDISNNNENPPVEG